MFNLCEGGLAEAKALAQIILLDLKSPNVLLARDWTAKIADFGVAKILRTDFLTTLKDMGTFAWAAPEVLLGKPCTEKARLLTLAVHSWRSCDFAPPDVVE